ncbi:hypothetical protein MPSEU_001048600 [Mayamaea pseudoterrestris]|nr:hypothetical protein MPSEU_001048600 [Mayamaea pseudoterrestris]
MISPVSNAFARSSMAAQRRFVSTQYMNLKARGVKTNWLSDPSTYPLIACLTGAMFLCVGFGLNFLRTSKDVRLVEDKKRSVIRNW